MTYTCTVAWCRFDGRSLAALRRHIRQCHPWLVARERQSKSSRLTRPLAAHGPLGSVPNGTHARGLEPWHISHCSAVRMPLRGPS